MIQKIPVPKRLQQKLKRGYPWIFRTDIPHKIRDGELVNLVDSKNKVCGFGLADSGDISVRVLGRNPNSVSKILEERIQTAFTFRSRFLQSNTNCFRLINGEGDGLSGIIIDIYDSTAILRLYSKAWIKHLQIIVDILQKNPLIERVHRKFGVRNVDGLKGGVTLSGSELPEYLIVLENNIQFLVRPNEGQKTGLFLDQREHRRIIGTLSKNKVVSNLFAYNGGFSIYAALGGAKRVYSIDIAPKAIDDAREIFRLNGIDPKAHVFEVQDAFKWVSPEPMDIFICDPPSLSKGKRSDRNASQAYQDLASTCAKQILKGNLLATASCTARLSSKEWEQSITQGISKYGQWSWNWRSYEPIDHPVSMGHPEGRYLKFALLHRRQ